MKKSLSWLIMGLLVMSLAACATTNKGMEGAKVKCPACGYEFDVPASRP